jgi:cytochrome c-type biogenesis protein CcmH
MKRPAFLVSALLCAALCVSGFALAVEPQEMLKDPALEARAREVSKGLRCVQCQNETIDESHAEIARDMRILVRDRITAGDTNQQILDYMVGRYGDYVLLKPRFMGSTLILWFGPFVILVIGGFVVASRLKLCGPPAEPLTPEEEATLASLTDTGDKAP